MSLIQTLHNQIKQAYPRVFTLDEVSAICQQTGHKSSYGERKLRHDRHQSPAVQRWLNEIEVIRNQKGYVVGYRFIPQRAAVREVSEILQDWKESKVENKQGALL